MRMRELAGFGVRARRNCLPCVCLRRKRPFDRATHWGVLGYYFSYLLDRRVSSAKWHRRTTGRHHKPALSIVLSAGFFISGYP